MRKQPDREHRWRYLTRDEIDRLLAVVHPRLKPIVATALFTGMRRGEILALDWRDVDLRQGFINILQSKSAKRREVPIPEKLKTMFMALGPQPQGRVFILPIISLRKYHTRALKDAGIKDFRFHDLRHTFASHYIMETKDLAALQRILGHSTPQLTLRYAHLGQPHYRENSGIFQMAMPDIELGANLAPSPAKKSDEQRIDIVKSKQSVLAQRGEAGRAPMSGEIA